MRGLQRLEGLVGEHHVEAGPEAEGDVAPGLGREVGGGQGTALIEREALAEALGGGEACGGGLEVLVGLGKLPERELELGASRPCFFVLAEGGRGLARALDVVDVEAAAHLLGRGSGRGRQQAEGGELKVITKIQELF